MEKAALCAMALLPVVVSCGDPHLGLTVPERLERNGTDLLEDHPPFQIVVGGA